MLLMARHYDAQDIPYTSLSFLYARHSLVIAYVPSLWRGVRLGSGKLAMLVTLWYTNMSR